MRRLRTGWAVLIGLVILIVVSFCSTDKDRHDHVAQHGSHVIRSGGSASGSQHRLWAGAAGLSDPLWFDWHVQKLLG